VDYFFCGVFNRLQSRNLVVVVVVVVIVIIVPVTWYKFEAFNK
jgi:hypothetical protein